MIRNTINFVHKFGMSSVILPELSQVRHYAARKGTREKAKKKKIKQMVEKLTFADKMKIVKRSKLSARFIKPDMVLYNNEDKSVATDDVYYGKFFQWKKYSFAEAILSHREYFHPTMYNKEDPYVNIFVELNMKIVNNKYAEAFRKMVIMKHSFSLESDSERKILAFCNEDEVNALLKAGASAAGGTALIKQIMKGQFSLKDYTIVIARSSLMADILPIRGLLKRRLPNYASKTLGKDVLQLLHDHLNSIHYVAARYDEYPQYGHTTVCIGKLNMPVEQLEENMKCVINSIMSAKPKRLDNFITRIRVQCADSKEKFQIDHKLYIVEEVTDDKASNIKEVKVDKASNIIEVEAENATEIEEIKVENATEIEEIEVNKINERKEAEAL